MKPKTKTTRQKASEAEARAWPKAGSPMHVDDFIWKMYLTDRYARFVLMMLRLPAPLQIDWREQISENPLYATCNGRRWRVTMASRFGDIGLHEDLDADSGYDIRVNVAMCSEWSKLP